MKKLTSIIGLAGALLAGAAQAHDYDVHWLAGVSAGYVDRSGDFSATVFDQRFNNREVQHPFALAGKVDGDGFMYGVLAGIEARCKKWLVGFEFNIDHHGNDSEATYVYRGRGESIDRIDRDTRITTHADLERDTVMGLTMRVGYTLCNWLTPYGRIGVETSRDFLKIARHVEILGEGGLVRNNVGPVLYDHNSDRSYRLVVGVGAEMSLESYLPNTTLRVEYNYHNDSDKVDVLGFAHAPGANGLTGQAVGEFAKQDANSIRASLVYNFL